MLLSDFRGVFMRDSLPTKPWKNEQMVVNLDSNKGDGTHWVCFSKKGNTVKYFDSFGNLQPPMEIGNYLKGANIYYNREQLQKWNSWNCGHLCLKFLYKEKFVG